MAGPGILVELVHVLNHRGAQGIEVDVAHQLKQVGIVLAGQGFVAVLKKVSGALMATVEADGMAGQQPTHENAQIGAFGAQQEMGMVGNQGPGKASGAGFTKEKGKIASGTILCRYRP